MSSLIFDAKRDWLGLITSYRICRGKSSIRIWDIWFSLVCLQDLNLCKKENNMLDFAAKIIAMEEYL